MGSYGSAAAVMLCCAVAGGERAFWCDVLNANTIRLEVLLHCIAGIDFHDGMSDECG